MANDRPLLERFLQGELASETFRHADHVQVGFELLQAHDFSNAAYRFSAALKAIAAQAGRPGKYHETITLAFLALIAERSASRPFADFEDFALANPDLMDTKVLERWYAPERLSSDLARRVFLLPEAAR
jgi:hypothetical protein